MNCEDCLLMLDEYVESELDEKSSAQVSAHLDSCQACAGEYEMMRRELRAYSEFLPNMEASPALWANVQVSVEKAKRERFSLKKPSRWIAASFGKRAFNPAFTAVPLALLIALVVTIGLIKYKSTENMFDEKIVSQKIDVKASPEKPNVNTENEKPSDNKKQSSSKPEEKITIAKVENRVNRSVPFFALLKPKTRFFNTKAVIPDRNPTTAEIIEKAERQYNNAVAVLSGDIKRRRAQLAPDLTSQLDESLAEIDRTISETKRAVRTQPNDAVAIQYMTTAYAKKIELLRTIVAPN